MRQLAAFVCCFVLLAAHARNENRYFRKEADRFVQDYRQLGISETGFDFKEYFSQIPSLDKIEKQEIFFRHEDSLFRAINPGKLAPGNRVMLSQLLFETRFNLERLALEKSWHEKGRPMPGATLYDLPDGAAWYAFFVKRFTSLETPPEQIMAFGLAEVKRINREIDSLQQKQGYASRGDFYTYLRSERFFITDKQEILAAFREIDSTVRSRLPGFVPEMKIPPVHALEWEGAGQFTPPGMYLSKADNAYGHDVFLFNFYGGRFNRRALDWIYMHEAIPGHHLQHYFPVKIKDNPLTALFSYSGNFEGWACYIENYGHKLGLYRSDEAYLGKCEWDLVRSARLVLECGIHTQGWDKEKAMAFWKAHIFGLDEIAEREITRVTNWPGQALSYKLGAQFIETLKKEHDQSEYFNEALFHQAFLEFSGMPLEVASEHFSLAFTKLK